LNGLQRVILIDQIRTENTHHNPSHDANRTDYCYLFQFIF
jgi:hypothetical protein